MRRRIAPVVCIVALFLSLARPASSFSSGGYDGETTPPDWASTPNSDQMANAYPELANDLGMGGHVTLSCKVDSRGIIERCRVLAETPKGLKFGRAALRLTPLFRFRPAMTITGPMPSMITIPIRFVPPPDDIRRAIPFMALLAAFTTGLAWFKRRAGSGGWVPEGRASDA